MRKQMGFTLIELLVVIAIIAILAAILFPVFAQAREKARTTSCLSNTKQIGLAIMMYAQDYDETYFEQDWPGGCPASETGYFADQPGQTTEIWAVLLYPYVKNGGIFDCPSYQGTTYTASLALWQCGDPNKQKIVPYVEYGTNEAILGGHASTLATLAEPASVGLITDNSYIFGGPGVCLNLDGQYKLYWVEARTGFGDGSDISWYNGKPRHSHGSNFAFADGHSKWARASDVAPNVRTSTSWIDTFGFYRVLYSNDICTPPY